MATTMTLPFGGPAAGRTWLHVLFVQIFFPCRTYAKQMKRREKNNVENIPACQLPRADLDRGFKGHEWMQLPEYCEWSVNATPVMAEQVSQNS